MNLGQLDGRPGLLLYDGPSRLDAGTRILALAAGFRGNSANSKTGPAIQISIVTADVEPITAAKTGADVAICGDCRYRRTNEGGCYVSIAHGPQRTWYAHTQLGAYPAVSDWSVFGGRTVRIGAYGDPAAVPLDVWQRVLEHTARAVGGRGHMAYTHQWRNLGADWQWCMASVDSPDEAAEAKAAGWRHFRVRTGDQPLLPGERVCPSAKEAASHGGIQCVTCRGCGGDDAPKRPNWAIRVHGSKRRQAATAVVRAAGRALALFGGDS